MRASLVSCLTFASTISFFYLSAPCLQHQSETLIRVAMVFRHGDRTIYDRYPGDPNNGTFSTEWPDGALQLTAAGRRRMMQAGIVLRERYSPFLGRDVDEVSAVSSSANRCIQSARLVLTAAYPQSIVPITVSVPEHDILGADTSCAAWQEATELQFLDPHVEIFFRNEEPFLNNVSQWSGQSFNYMADPQKLYETLSIEQENNKTIPEWADASVMTQLREVDEKIFCINTSSPLIRTLEVGRLLKDLGTRFLRGTGSQKLFLYSTHDRVLLSLMKQLFPSDVTAVPGYGATLIMEMFRSAGSNDTTLHTYFLPDPNTPKLQPLQFKGCELTCPLTPVTALVDAAALTQSQHETVCNMPINVSTPTDCF